MFWVIALIIVIVVSSILAYRSMGSFQKSPAINLPYGLFLIRNKQAFTLETLTKLYAFAQNLKITFSIEKLFKGEQSAFVIFAPTSVSDFLPELQLLQLENYLPIASDTFIWQIAPLPSIKKIMVPENFLKNIHLENDQQFFWQIVLGPQKRHEFQVTIRAMVVDSLQTQRLELARILDKHIKETTGLIKMAREENNPKMYQAFEGRILIKEDVQNFPLSFGETLQLL